MKRSKNAVLVTFLIGYVVAVLVLVNGFYVQGRIDQIREEEGHVERQIDISPDEFIGSGLIGGFRALAVDYLWVKIIRLEFDKQYYEIQSTADLITKLEPNYPAVWIFNAWNLSYNIAIEWKAREERWHWIRKGIETIQKGLRKNPGSVELEFYLGWLYYHKVSSETGDRDYYWMMAQVREEMGEEPLLLAAEHFRKAKNKGTHPIYSQRVLEIREISALQQAARYLLLDKPVELREEGDVEKGFRVLAESVALAERMAEMYPEHEGFRNRVTGYCMEVVPALMEKFPERTEELDDALARLIIVIQSYKPEYQYRDVE